MKFIILLVFSLPIYAFQDCTIKMLIDPVKKNIRANDITYGAGNDIAIDSFTIPLELSPSKIKKRVWRCKFSQSVNRQNIVVNYTLIASNGQSGGVSNGSSFIPTTMITDRLRFRNNDKVVRGDIGFQFNLNSPQAKLSGNYTGVLTIEVYEN